jgi:hypothetical protein
MVDKIEETAFLTLMINCDHCGASLDTFEADPPVDPMDEWAWRFAVRARTMGWQTDDRGRIFCPECSRKRRA